jgi:hypothetical protein
LHIRRRAPEGGAVVSDIALLKSVVEASDLKSLVTEEMVEAGFQVLAHSGTSDDYGGAERLLVEEIYRAMFAVLLDPNVKMTLVYSSQQILGYDEI